MVEFRKDTIVLVKDLERSPQLISRECRLIGSTQIHLKLHASRRILVQEVQIDSFGKHAAHVCAHHRPPSCDSEAKPGARWVDRIVLLPLRIVGQTE